MVADVSSAGINVIIPDINSDTHSDAINVDTVCHSPVSRVVNRDCVTGVRNVEPIVNLIQRDSIRGSSFQRER